MDFTSIHKVLLSIPVGDRALYITPWVLFGFIGNALFTLRVLIQWIASERAKRSIVPVSFWWVSMVATIIMLIYSVGRHELAFTIGFTLNTTPYMRNLLLSYKVRRRWHALSFLVSAVTFVICMILLAHLDAVLVPSGWFYLGLAGNLIFSSRFLLQWLYAEHKKESVLPLWFWNWSMLGAVLCLTYGIILLDPVYILGYLFNIIPMIRNVMLHLNARRES